MPIKHGYAKRGNVHPMFYLWMGMIGRCEDPKRVGYSYYGGRGIRVCDRWRHDFAAFLSDVGVRPSSDHSLDRIDPNGNYEPSNVRWATRSEQQHNRRDQQTLLLLTCRHGHPWTPETTRFHARGRCCRVCDRISRKQSEERKRHRAVR